MFCTIPAKEPGRVVVCIICDRGDRYLSTGVFAPPPPLHHSILPNIVHCVGFSLKGGLLSGPGCCADSGALVRPSSLSSRKERTMSAPSTFFWFRVTCRPVWPQNSKQHPPKPMSGGTKCCILAGCISGNLDLTLQSYRKTLSDQHTPIFMLFTAPWCPETWLRAVKSPP